MRRWLELKEDADDPAFVERFKSDFQPVRIYVLTPQGRVVELPRGATPLDFAYAVHTEIGHRCRGAKVDGRIVPLTQALESGQTVEILTCKEGGPSRDWMSAHLGYLKTAKALNRVRAWFKQQDHDQHVAAGRTQLEKELARAGAPKPDLEKLASRFSFRTPADLLAAIGRGDVSAQQIAQSEERRRPPEPEQSFAERLRRPAKAAEPSRGLVIVEGVGDLMTHMAKCCKPVPRDSIVGYITRGRGVTVHRRDCPGVTALPPDHRSRLVNVMWNERVAAEPGAYVVDVAILASDRKGLLRDVSAVFTNEEVDVLAVQTQSDRKTERASMRFTAEIKDLSQLRRILDKLSQIPDVLDVRRGT
ncbi:MAG: TGS domain-containing protein [Gammaproteobacteria bacterium]|nr:TGS domain-containing protein [Gammaproteobacteria bacterium]